MAFLFILPTWPVDVWTAAMKKVAPDLDVPGVGRVRALLARADAGGVERLTA